MREEVIYEAMSGRLYYRRDVKHDPDGYYLYDKHARRDVDVPRNVMEGEERDRSRDSRNSRSTKTYKVEGFTNRTFPGRKDEGGNKVFENKEVDYSKLNVFTISDKVNSNKGLYNTMLESMDMENGTHIVPLYPNTKVKKHAEDLEKIKSYIELLVIKPAEMYNGEPISDEADVFISELVGMSFRDVKMIDVCSNLSKLMKVYDITDPGWNMLISKLNKAKEGKVESNIYLLPDEFKCISDLMSGTDTFVIPDGLKEKINVPHGGFIKVGNIVYTLYYNKCRLFMVIP